MSCYILKMLFIGALSFAFEGLEVMEVRESHPVYEDFCKTFEDECDLTRSKQIVKASTELFSILDKVNSQVNESLVFALDIENYGVEEKWSIPFNGSGDCEDNALLKRKTLVEDFNLPRGALRMVTAFHKSQFYAHALLAVNTDKGVFILDQDQKEVLYWKNSPYIFEAWELPGRRWQRFFQEW